jgi:hypothetical protein
MTLDEHSPLSEELTRYTEVATLVYERTDLPAAEFKEAVVDIVLRAYPPLVYGSAPAPTDEIDEFLAETTKEAPAND